MSEDAVEQASAVLDALQPVLDDSLASALADLVGARERVLDEHMYRLPPRARWHTTFRLHYLWLLGCARSRSPRRCDSDSASLTNAAETCATTVWRHYFPNGPELPIWVAHMIIDAQRHLTVVAFTVDKASAR